MRSAMVSILGLYALMDIASINHDTVSRTTKTFFPIGHHNGIPALFRCKDILLAVGTEFKRRGDDAFVDRTATAPSDATMSGSIPNGRTLQRHA